MHIRLATIEDVPALRQLIEDSVRGLSVSYYSPQQIESALHDVFGVDTQLIIDETYFIADVTEQWWGLVGGANARNCLAGTSGSLTASIPCWIRPQSRLVFALFLSIQSGPGVGLRA